MKKIAKKQSGSWTSAALPGGEIPDIRSDLGILSKGIDTIMFSDKSDSTIVPTILPGFNRAIRVGGAPTGCVMAIHGPSKGGKTAFCLALVRSFQLQGHACVYVDAELTLDKKFSLDCGVDNSQLSYLAPMTYEETVGKVGKMIMNFVAAREKGEIHQSKCLLVVVDSLNKLVPQDELDGLLKAGKAYPVRALMNTIWMDKLTPVVGSHPILFVILAHEKQKMDAGPFQKSYRVKGGESVIYDSAVIVRITRIGTRKRTVKGKGLIVAHVCEGLVEKTKVGISLDRFRFVMGQGRAGYPVGFDYCEQIVEEVKMRGGESPITRTSSGVWRHRLVESPIKTDAAFVDWLRANPFAVDEMTTELNDTAIEAVVSEDIKSEGVEE